MTIDLPIQTVVIAGAGIAGWSAAAAIKRHIPSLDVIVVGGPPSDSLIDRVISTLPSIQVFHQDLGLTDADTVRGARSSLRIGTLFKGWSSEQPDYVHAYGSYGAPTGGVAFHQLWLREHGVEAFECFSRAAQLGRMGRMPVATAGSSDPVPAIGFGLRLTPGIYFQMMRAFALHLGAKERAAQIVDVNLRGTDGFISQLSLSDGGSVSGDLFVDCTGPAAVLRSRMDGDFIDWNRWLPCDRVILVAEPADAMPDLLDQVTAVKAGWCWSASSPQVASHGATYSSANGRRDDAIEGIPLAARARAEEIAIRPGRWTKPWTRNCVPIGDSAVGIEPLEWTNLHLAHSQIDRLIAMMPGRDCAPVETAEYNRECNAEADRIRDFICVHYVAARREEPFWKDAAAIEPPDSLAHTLSLFAERGRLPFYEEETFTRDGWLAVLLGQGFLPRRVDPLADIMAPDEARRVLKDHAQSVRAFVDAQPSYRDYLSQRGAAESA